MSTLSRLSALAIRAQQGRRTRDFILAAVLTAVVVPLVAVAYLWLSPLGCALQDDPDIHPWCRLFPGLLVIVPVIVGAVLTDGLVLNRRSAHPWPGLVVVAVAGGASQVGFVGGYLSLLPACHAEIP